MRPNTIIYPPDNIKPVGVIEFVHGMCETRNRYATPMKFFSEKGYICAIADMRGHGENILTTEDLGYFGEDGYIELIEDVHDYTMYLKREFPKLPFILLGHSMGSLVVRAYMKKYSKEVDAVILSGSPSENPMAGLGKLLTKFIAFFRGWRYRSPLIENLVNEPFEKPFAREGIINSWLTTNKYIVEEYNKDSLCGVPFTLNGYYSLFSLMEQVYSKYGWTNRNKQLPIMYMSGGDDPCRKNDKAFKKAVSHLKHCGFSNTFSKLYSGMRHELFNELNNDEVYDDILKFLEFKVGIDMPQE